MLDGEYFLYISWNFGLTFLSLFLRIKTSEIKKLMVSDFVGNIPTFWDWTGPKYSFNMVNFWIFIILKGHLISVLSHNSDFKQLHRIRKVNDS